MSGPKSSNYRLSAARLRALQIEAERRRQEEIIRKKKLALKEQLKGQQEYIFRIVTLAKSVLDEAFVTEAIKKRTYDVLTMCQQITRRCINVQSSDDLTYLEHECAEIKTDVQNIKTEIDSIYSVLPQVIKDERTKIEDSIANGFKFDLPDAVQNTVNRNTELRREIDSRLDELRVLSLPQIALIELEKLFQKAETITSTDFLENYLTLDIDPFIKRCKSIAEADYTSIRTRYELLANERKIAPLDFEYSAQGIRDMQAASDELEAAILADRERAYIHEALEDAIREMGYRLIGDRIVVRQKTGKRIKHQLYTLRDGTAVDITFSDNGQVAMELGGIAHTDRTPTAEESAELVEDMRSFCHDYEQLEKKLAERGIETSRISLLPSEAEYARMINAERYNLAETVIDYEIQRAHKHENQYMRRED